MEAAISLDAIAKLRKATIIFVKLFLLSVRLQGKTRPLFV